MDRTYRQGCGPCFLRYCIEQFQRLVFLDVFLEIQAFLNSNYPCHELSQKRRVLCQRGKRNADSEQDALLGT